MLVSWARTAASAAGCNCAAVAPLATMRSALALMAAMLPSLARLRVAADHTAAAVSVALWLARLLTVASSLVASRFPAEPAP